MDDLFRSSDSRACGEVILYSQACHGVQRMVVGAPVASTVQRRPVAGPLLDPVQPVAQTSACSDSGSRAGGLLRIGRPEQGCVRLEIVPTCLDELGSAVARSRRLRAGHRHRGKGSCHTGASNSSSIRSSPSIRCRHAPQSLSIGKLDNRYRSVIQKTALGHGNRSVVGACFSV